jgi:hypothetical protein
MADAGICCTCGGGAPNETSSMLALRRRSESKRDGK